jgi:D-tyrosyl-tRNA(Tyr) deacylase
VRIVLQRVTRAAVRVDGGVIASIGPGLLLLVGAAAEDDDDTARRIARKCFEMRIFRDDAGRFDRSLAEAGGEVLVVSQFTLLADVRKGRRPTFTAAAPPETAQARIDAFVDELRTLGANVSTGRFGAMMEVELVNDGPVTIVVDSADLDQPRRS